MGSAVRTLPGAPIGSAAPTSTSKETPMAKWGFILENRGSIDPRSALFPLTSPYTRRPGTEEPHRVIGTGFFIAKPGIFLTARHCLYRDEDMQEGWEDLTATCHCAVGLRSYAVGRDTDIAIGQLDFGDCPECINHRVFQLCTWDPEPREKMIHWGCSDSDIDLLSTYTLADGRVHDKLTGRAVYNQHHGHFEEFHPKGVGLANWPCYRTTAEFKSGDSGGPVTNGIGRVCAVNSSSSEGGGYSTSTLVRDIMDTNLPRNFLVNDEPRDGDVTFREAFSCFGAEILQDAEELNGGQS